MKNGKCNGSKTLHEITFVNGNSLTLWSDEDKKLGLRYHVKMYTPRQGEVFWYTSKSREEAVSYLAGASSAHSLTSDVDHNVKYD